VPFGLYRGGESQIGGRMEQGVKVVLAHGPVEVCESVPYARRPDSRRLWKPWLGCAVAANPVPLADGLTARFHMPGITESCDNADKRA
jgi:hypothetical protein